MRRERRPLKRYFAGDIDLSGMSTEEAARAVEAYVEGLKDTEITLLAAADTEVVVTAGEDGGFLGESGAGNRGGRGGKQGECD